jgi:hypothetical protein
MQALKHADREYVLLDRKRAARAKDTTTEKFDVQDFSTCPTGIECCSSEEFIELYQQLLKVYGLVYIQGEWNQAKPIQDEKAGDARCRTLWR